MHLRETIFDAGMRALFTTACAVVGIAAGLIPIFLFLGIWSGTSTTELDTKWTIEVVPDALGHREILPKETPVLLKMNVQSVIGLETLTSANFRSQLIESREGVLKNNRVKAILVHINSGGGTVTDSDGIYRALKDYKNKYKVPVYAYVDGMCASGALYIAAAADKVYASDVSLIGSVGVRLPSFFNITGLMEKLGVEAKLVYSGTGKEELNPFVKWKENESEMLQGITDYYYNHFMEIMAQNRPSLTVEKLKNEYGAKIFPAPIAKDLGYIDEINEDLYKCMTDLAEVAGISDQKYQVIELQDKKWYTDLFSSKTSLFKGEMVHKLEMPAECDTKLADQFLYLY